MRKSSKTVGISLLILCIIVSVIFFNNYGADADAVKVRLGGSDRYETAAAVSKNGWATGSKTIVLVYGDDYPDALSAAPLAKKYNAPILLTTINSLPASISNEISRLKPTKVYIVGGTGVVSTNIESQIRAKGISDIQRLGGINRYETATLVANQVGTSSGVVLASGNNFPDALSIAAIAANSGMPILLTDKDNFTSYNKNFLQNKTISQTYIIGGDGVISNSNMANYKNPVRIGGANRYETNTKILEYFKGTINLNKIYLAAGNNFPDGLVGAPIAALTGSHIILTEESNSYFPLTLGKIKGIKSSQVSILGGSGVISDSLVNKVIEAVNYEEVFKVLSID